MRFRFLVLALLCFAFTSGHVQAMDMVVEKVEETLDGQCKMLSEGQIGMIQSSLAERDFYKGALDGIWDQETLEAVNAYQASRGKDPNGILKTEDLESLGLDPSLFGVREYTTTETEMIEGPIHGNGPNATGKAAFME